MGRTLTFDIFRYNPQDPSSKPHMQSYQLPEHPRMNLFVALNMIREQQDPTLQFKIIGDLSVDTGTWFRGVDKKIESWIHTSKQFDPTAQEERMDNEKAIKIFELDRCIECGCCVAACGTALMRKDFIGATAINRMARFYIDPRDERTPADYYDLIGDDNGVFGCMGLLGCHSVCPKSIPLQDQLGIMRRMVTMQSVKGIIPEFIRKKLAGEK